MKRALLLLAVAAPAFAGSVLTPVESGGVFAVSVKSLREVRFAHTIRQRYDFSCGAAAVATLLTHHYGTPTDEQSAFEAMFAAGDVERIRREGFSLLDMKNFLAKKGFQGEGFVATLAQLEAAAVPAIALIRENGYHHFVVIKGLKLDRVLIGDPATGTRSVPRSSFEGMRVGKVLFVVRNRSELARFNLDADWRAAPFAPIASILPNGAPDASLMRRGPNDH